MHLYTRNIEISNLVIYGIGKRGILLCRLLEKAGIDNVTIVDSNSEKWGHYIGKILIHPPEKLKSLSQVNICISVADLFLQEEIRTTLREICEGNFLFEVSYEEILFSICKDCTEIKELLKQKIDKNDTSHIFFDCYHNGLGLGGVEWWTKDICEEFLKHGHDNFSIISKKGDYSLSLKLREKVNFFEINQDPFIKNIIDLIVEIRNNLPCTVITAGVNEVLIAAACMKEYYSEDVKIISVIHGGNPAIYRAHIEYKDFIDLYIGVSKDIEREMIVRGISSDRICTMSCPFECKKDLVRGYTLDRRKPIRIAYAGRLDSFAVGTKRMDLLLELAKTLDEKNVHFELRLAGDGPVRKTMELYVKEHKLEEKVLFCGNIERSKLSSFMLQQDIYVSLSDSEGRSISTIEAMGNGVVPIVTEVSGTKEDITNGMNGYLIPLRDYNMMANRIQYLEENRNKLPEMGSLAHDAVYPKSLMSRHFQFWKNVLFDK